MAFNLAQYVRQQYEEQQRNKQEMERETNEQLTTQHLIPSPQSSTEVQNSYDSTVKIVQPNQSINEYSNNVHLSNVAQSIEGGNTVEQPTSSGNEDKIKMTAALLSMILYICAISLIIYGSIHLNDCPAQKMITITYIVMGCLMLVSRLLSSPEECRNIFKKESNPQFVPQDICRWCLNLLVQLATICFFFALCYWAFSINPDTKEGSPNYCAKELYNNTWYACIVALVILGFGFVLTCSGVCCVVCAVLKANE